MERESARSPSWARKREGDREEKRRLRAAERERERGRRERRDGMRCALGDAADGFGEKWSRAFDVRRVPY